MRTIVVGSIESCQFNDAFVCTCESGTRSNGFKMWKIHVGVEWRASGGCVSPLLGLRVLIAGVTSASISVLTVLDPLRTDETLCVYNCSLAIRRIHFNYTIDTETTESCCKLLMNASPPASPKSKMHAGLCGASVEFNRYKRIVFVYSLKSGYKFQHQRWIRIH